MRKKIILTIMVALSLTFVVACGSKNTESVTSENIKAEFKEEAGIYTYLDTENSPFENAGLKINIEKEAKKAKFIITDSNGNETADYYLFDFENSIAEKYYYVSAMGNGYYISVNLEDGKAFKMEDNDKKDITEKAKESGRWENAALGAEEEIENVKTYFEKSFEKKIEEFIKE